MSILCITNDFGPRAGGIETFVMGLIERFPHGSVVVYTSSQPASSEYDRMWREKYGVEVIRDKSTMLLPTPRVARRVNALVTERGITKVWFGAAAPLALLAQSLRKHGVQRIIALTHGHEVWWAKVPPFSFAMRRIGKGVDHLTYLGEFTKREISKGVNRQAQRAMVKIAPGIDVDHFAPQKVDELRRSLHLDAKRVIVSVGRLVPRKGQDILLKALPEIRKAIPNAHVLMVGTGEYESTLRSILRKNGCADAVTFTGRINYEDLPRYICLGEVFVMPSRSRLAGLEVEGLGIVYLEASSCGIPVVAGNSGGAPDAVQHGRTGFAVDGTSVKEVAQATIEILSDHKLAESMGKTGRAWIEREWRWQIWSEKFLSLLK